MEKLLKLLKEYAPDYCKDYPDDIIMDEIVISKRFGFVEWLCSNDKIDNKRIDNVVEDCGTDEIGAYFCKCYGAYESLLMLLAISDTPIDDLISYLK